MRIGEALALPWTDLNLQADTPRTLHRTVGTLIAHSAGLDAAWDVLGKRDPSVTARHYVAGVGRVVEVRHTLDLVFVRRQGLFHLRRELSPVSRNVCAWIGVPGG